MPIDDQQDLQQALTGRFKPGEAVAVRIDRGGTEQTITATLGEQPAS